MIPEPVLQAFGVGETLPVRLLDSQGTTWRAGPLILKPTEDEAEAAWTANLYATLAEGGFRVPRPVKSRRGAYIVHGWTAWEYVGGEPEAGRVGHGTFRGALEGVPRPPSLDERRDPWARADRLTCDAFLLTVHPCATR